MVGAAQSWSGELLFLQMKSASPKNKEKLMEQFNKSLGFHADSIREWKHVSGISCPHCGPDQKRDIVCNGRMKPGDERQRYRCRSCGCSFNDHTNTVFHRSKKIEKWPAFLQCMLDGLTIRDSARKVGISPTTAQTWRKKIMAHLMLHLSATLSGIVECGEVTIKSSNKGQKRGNNHIPGSKNTLVFCKSRRGDVFVGCIDEWEELISEGMRKEKIIILHADRAEGMSSRARAKRNLLNSNNITPIVEQFTRNYTKMRGVAGKYLRQYAAWHQFLVTTNGTTPKEKLSRLLRLSL